MLRPDFRGDAAVDLVLNDVGQSFIRQLSEADSETLLADLAKIAFGDDTEALAAAEREVLASLDAESHHAAGAPGRTQ